MKFKKTLIIGLLALSTLFSTNAFCDKNDNLVKPNPIDDYISSVFNQDCSLESAKYSPYCISKNAEIYLQNKAQQLKNYLKKEKKPSSSYSNHGWVFK